MDLFNKALDIIKQCKTTDDVEKMFKSTNKNFSPEHVLALKLINNDLENNIVEWYAFVTGDILSKRLKIDDPVTIINRIVHNEIRPLCKNNPLTNLCTLDEVLNLYALEYVSDAPTLSGAFGEALFDHITKLSDEILSKDDIRQVYIKYGKEIGFDQLALVHAVYATRLMKRSDLLIPGLAIFSDCEYDADVIYKLAKWIVLIFAGEVC